MNAKQLKVISARFNEKDTKLTKENFNGENILTLVGSADSEEEIIEKFQKYVPDIVMINIIGDTEGGMNIIRKIQSMTDDKCPPFFIVAYNTDESDTNNDPITSEISKIGFAFYRYNNEHDINSIIRFANRMTDVIKDEKEREKSGIYWKISIKTE